MAAQQKRWSPRGTFNNDMASAQAQADLRYNMKPLDRQGMSRAAGQQYMGGIAAAQNLASGVAQAYGNQAGQAVSSADRELADAASQEGLGLDTSAIGMQDQYARALNALARQQASYGMYRSALNGLIGGNLDGFLGF
jgi:hypothetical protein